MEDNRHSFSWRAILHSPKLQRMIFTLTLVLGLAGCTISSQENTPAQAAPSAQMVIPSAKIDSHTIRYAVFPAPPYMIGAGDEDTEMSGIDVEIVQEIARRMNLQVEYIKCTWARCLELMKTGEADLLSSAYKKPDREEYMLYLGQPFLDQLPISFYYLKERNYTITKYEDIYQFNAIGVLNEASYFERFDQDVNIKKFKVTSQDQLFPMLLAGRLDIIAGYVPTENYRIAVEGYRDQIERSEYEYQEQALVFMSISKKSPLAARFNEIDQINQKLLNESFIKSIINRYYEKYR